MLLSYLLALAWATACAAPIHANPDCPQAQISRQHCQRYLWARGRQQELSDGLSGLERRLSSFEKLPFPAPAVDLARAAADGGELWRAGNLVSQAIDHLGSPQLQGSLELRARANAANERLAGARDRLLALQRRANAAIGGPLHPAARWLSAPGFFRAAGLHVDQRSAAGARPQPAKIARALAPGKSSAAQRQAFRASARSFAQEQRQAALLSQAHDNGQTRTFGDPRGRAALLHRQTGQTCAVVAAQQLLLEHGRLDPDEPAAAQENALYEEAVASGYFRGSRRTGGTPWQYVGNLAQDHGLIIIKRVRASDAELAAAVSSGKMVLADVDSSVFWHNRDYRNATHSVVVTGLERHGRSGKVLGYYVNDSDAGVYYAAGRLVPAETFLKAWRARAARFIEVK